MITFAVIGHNEEPTLRRALDDAFEAMEQGDEVWYVDSGSTDGSRELAESCGARVIRGPLGKGRAITAALASNPLEYVCSIDADIFGSERNIPATLAEAVRSDRADLVVGSFTEPRPGVLSNTIGVYIPLVEALFPEAAGRFGDRPLTGFRIFRSDIEYSDLPPGFGIETHINLTFAHGGREIAVAPIGEYQGRFLYKPRMGEEIGKAVLDFAERTGRLDPELRPQWDEWVDVVVDHVATYHGDAQSREAFRAELVQLAQRPLPPALRQLQ